MYFHASCCGGGGGGGESLLDSKKLSGCLAGGEVGFVGGEKVTGAWFVVKLKGW